ncbi:hypothetical protein J2Y58_001303 [Sphingomonas sp. BE138]|uniref:hypothetical protein n=1 Tax=Sphingomonas sp. BE138 TaxID=2817845 RepID=UPI002864CFFE|nr:hypothetical protein [Sphingomonas sp. BE138]MDR6787951.1 hypothetical protein [Sphingomonas sp. BE138]
MRLAPGVLLVLLAACGQPADPVDDAAAGRALEAAARNVGIVADAADAAGVYAAGEDRACLTGAAPRYRIGVSVDYGGGQRCLAHGEARGKRNLTVDLGGGCRFTATRDGDRMSFPAQTPVACATVCQGRATLDALALDRLSEAAGEAARLRGADGKLLCAD